MHRKRPIEVTLVAWVALLAAAVRVVLLGFVIVLPEVRESLGAIEPESAPGAWVRFPAWVHYLVSLLGIGIFTFAGIGLLRGAPWSRFALVTWGGLGLIFSFLSTGSLGYIAWDAVIYGAMLVMLFSPRARAYFRRGSNADDTRRVE